MKNFSEEKFKNSIIRSKSELLPEKPSLGEFLDTIKNIEDYTISLEYKKIYIKLYSYSSSNLAELSNIIKTEYDPNIEILEMKKK